MKWIKLLSTAYVNGVMRHPHEGVLHLEDDEGQRLLDGGLANDVSDDFSAKQDKAPAESVTVESGTVPTPFADHPHQADIASSEAAAPTPTRGRAAAHKE